MYKCTFCVDEYATGVYKESEVRDAVTLVPFVQQHGATGLGQPPVITAVALPCCTEHRKEMVKGTAGGKLIRA